MQDPSSNLAAKLSADASSRDPSHWVDLHADGLYRFAILRVKNSEVAEDLVQETFLAAIQAVDRFKGGSSVRTWLVAILKRKIIDYFRKSNKEVPAADLTLWEEDDDREYFDKTGHWKRPLEDWKDSPEQLVESKDFWKTFHTCLSGLPEAHRRAFTLREIDGIDGDEICEVLSITSNNLWVMLHRARSKLRKCLDAKWFQRKPEGESKES